MSKILEKATAHFRNQISGEMKCLEVPEWEAKIYYKTVNNLRDEGKILELTQQGKSVEALVESLIIKARNEDGTKMFSAIDKTTLMSEVDPKVLVRVVGEINNVSPEDLSVGEAEKN
jgi:hypothetical protein